MDKIILNHKLFEGIGESNLERLFKCLECSVKKHPKQQVIFNEGQVTHNFGIVLGGNLHLSAYDFYGNRQILANIGRGEMFAESFAVAGEPLPFEVCAAQDSAVLYIKYTKMCAVCRNACSYHTQLINNMMQIMAVKNISLTQKIRHITAKNVREKVLSYLYSVSKHKKSNYFDIPFNRQELADYLSVDRSNLSNELSKLKQSGIIEFERNRFKINRKG